MGKIVSEPVLSCTKNLLESMESLNLFDEMFRLTVIVVGGLPFIYLSFGLAG